MEHDNVNHPQHYISKVGGRPIEVIDVIAAFTANCEPSEAYGIGNVLKYVCRWKQKNGLEDLKKARWYLDWIISGLEAPEDGDES